jgi:hypothetical protein
MLVSRPSLGEGSRIVLRTAGVLQVWQAEEVMSDTPRTDAKHMSPDKAVCKTCNDTGFIVSRSPTTGDEQRYQCNHDGTIFVPLPAASQNLWVCKARRSSGPEPQDCGWPSCGCDPFIDKTIRRAIRRSSPQRASIKTPTWRWSSGARSRER